MSSSGCRPTVAKFAQPVAYAIRVDRRPIHPSQPLHCSSGSSHNQGIAVYQLACFAAFALCSLPGCTQTDDYFACRATSIYLLVHFGPSHAVHACIPQLQAYTAMSAALLCFFPPCFRATSEQRGMQHIGAVARQ